MSEITGAPAAMDDAGITQAEHDSAIAAARSEGEASGIKAATDRFAAIVSADGINGNAGRMAAAVDLAMKSPGRATEDVWWRLSRRMWLAPPALRRRHRSPAAFRQVATRLPRPTSR